MENSKKNSKKVSRRNVIKDGVKIVGGLYFAAPLVFADDCVSCMNPGPKTLADWIRKKIDNFKEFFTNGYYSNGYYSNGYYSNGYYSNGYYSNGYYSNGYYSNGYYSNGYYRSV